MHRATIQSCIVMQHIIYNSRCVNSKIVFLHQLNQSSKGLLQLSNSSPGLHPCFPTFFPSPIVLAMVSVVFPARISLAILLFRILLARFAAILFARILLARDLLSMIVSSCHVFLARILLFRILLARILLARFCARVFLASLLAILSASCHVFLRGIFPVLFCARMFLARILLANISATALPMSLAMVLPKTTLVEFVYCSISTF